MFCIKTAHKTLLIGAIAECKIISKLIEFCFFCRPFRLGWPLAIYSLIDTVAFASWPIEMIDKIVYIKHISNYFVGLTSNCTYFVYAKVIFFIRKCIKFVNISADVGSCMK